MRKLCALLYELALLLAFLVAVLAAVNAHDMAHINITKMIGPEQVGFEPGEFASMLHAGDVLPVYRFNPDWKAKIGDVRVVEIRDGEVICDFDPGTFRWPMGRQGTVLRENDDKTVTLDLGSRLGFKNSDVVNLFRGRGFMGKARLTRVSAEAAAAIPLFKTSRVLAGATASEFIYPTQVSFAIDPWIGMIEWLVFAGAILLWALLRSFRPGCMGEVRAFVLRRVAEIDGVKTRFALNALLGIPFVFFGVTFSLGVVERFMGLLGFGGFDAAGLYVLFFFYVAAGLFYYYWLLRRKTSPILKFLSLFRYRPPRWEKIPAVARRVILWSLHLVIAYVFAWTLFSFLRADLVEAVSIAWPHSLPDKAGWTDLVRVAPHVFSTMPRLDSPERFFQFFQMLIWAVAIIPCLLGYGYSVLVEPFRAKIRNLDFTVAGWVTTGACYGPLFGAVLWASVPSYTGRDPIFSQGPLLLLVPAVGLMLNFLYMLTLVNMGVLFGVMTDKGLRDTGFYASVRHPSYMMECLMFFLMEMTGFSTWKNWLGGAVFLLVYIVRSEREDHFMSVSNPDFPAYKERVPYKYIAGII